MDGTGLRAERVAAPSGRVGWTVVNANGVAVGPAEAFLRYRFDCEASPNTLRAYAHDLKLFFAFLAERSLAWPDVSPAELGEFVAWLRRVLREHEGRQGEMTASWPKQSSAAATLE